MVKWEGGRDLLSRETKCNSGYDTQQSTKLKRLDYLHIVK